MTILKRNQNVGLAAGDVDSEEQPIYEKTLSGRIEIQAIKYADKIALDTKYKTYTYSELNNFANHIAQKILKKSRDGNQGVAILYEGTASMVPGMLGVLKAGKYYVVIDSSFPHDKIRHMLTDSKAQIIITNSKHLDLVAELASKGIYIINTDELDYTTESINPRLLISSNSRLSLVYTSGSTGMPKGIIKTYGAGLRSASQKHIHPNARIALLFSPIFAAGSWVIFGSILNGASLYSYDIKKDGLLDFPTWVRNKNITNLRLTPSLFRQFIKSLDANDIYPNLEIIRLSAETILSRDIQMYSKYFSKYAGLRVSFACTEVGTITHQSYEVGAQLPEGPVPLGFPTSNRTIQIWDENDQDVASGESGEIIVGGKDVFPSYWGDIKAAKTAFIPHPKIPKGYLYRTGDLGKILPDGQLVHLGRKDNMLKIRGYRVETAEIESVLLKQDDIENAVVVGRADKSGQLRLVAYIVLFDQGKLDVSKLRRAMAEKLSDYMIPAYFVQLEKIPLTASNKVDRLGLPNPKYDRPELGNIYRLANSDSENKLRVIWEKVLGINDIGVTDSFFDLGGDSLLAAQLFVEIEKQFDRKLPLSILYKAENVRQQAGILSGDYFDEDWSPLVSINADGSKTPLFCFPGKGGNPTRFRHLSERLGVEQPIHMLQSRGLSGKLSPFDSVEQIASGFMIAILEAQPTGPYNLIGSSFGGKVAYEVAQQLLRSGREVSLLAFVDAYGPGYPKRLPNTSRIKEKIFSLVQYFSKHAANLRIASWSDKFEYLTHNGKIGLQRIQNWPQILRDNYRSRQLTTELKEVEAANIRAGRAYVPTAYPGKVVLFRAEQQPWGVFENRTLGWGEVGIEELIIYDVPGHHGSILFEPRVGTLAKHLESLLKNE